MDHHTMDAALGNAWDDIGQLLTTSGQEDSSGLRRALAERLMQRDYHEIQRYLGQAIPPAQLERLRTRLVAAWGEPSEQ